MKPLVAIHIFVDAAKHLYRCVANFKNCSVNAPVQIHHHVNNLISSYRSSNRAEVTGSETISLKVPFSMIPSSHSTNEFHYDNYDL